MFMCPKKIMTATPGFLWALAFAASAETLSVGSAASGVEAKASTRIERPAIVPAVALSGEMLLAALQRGGLVLYLRHTETGAITEQCNVSNLSPTGKSEASALGKFLKQLRIPIARIASSPICRVQETAKLLDLGEIELSDALGNVPKEPGVDLHAARMRQIGMAPARGTNTLLVSHMQGGGPPEHDIDLAFGEVIVFRPAGHGKSEPVARIRIEDWPTLVSAKTLSK